MTSSIFLPRRSFAWPEPRTHFTESTMFVLPEPFGPTMAVTPPSNWISVCRAKVLKPSNCRDLRNKSVRGEYQMWVAGSKWRAPGVLAQKRSLGAPNPPVLRKTGWSRLLDRFAELPAARLGHWYNLGRLRLRHSD